MLNQAEVEDLARAQINNYRSQPRELLSHFNREESALGAYRGRQLLELLQNADDSGEGAKTCDLLLHLSRDRLVVANRGKPFSTEGITSLVISDCSPKQLDRNRFIGCKGLGFRSVLTWTDRPLVCSGAFEVAFDREYATSSIAALSADSPAVGAVVDNFEAATKTKPVPVMRFPHSPSPSKHLTEARALRGDGYDTVLVLPLPQRERGDEIYAQIVEQLDGLQDRALLFCRHLLRVEIAGDMKRSWALLRERKSERRQTVVLALNGKPTLWNVYRPPTGRIEGTHDRRTSTRDEYELAIAVPEKLLRSRPGETATGATLCVFFPTKIDLPCSLALHATLDLTDDRNHLEQSHTNEIVLAKLAEAVADTLVEEVSEAEPHRALDLLAGIESTGDGPLGFTRHLLQACAARKLFPRVDGSSATLAEVRRAPRKSWHAPLLARFLPEMLAPFASDHHAHALITRFAPRWFERDVLHERLKRLVQEVPHDEAGEVLGRLIGEGELREVTLSGIVPTSDGSLLPSGARAFFPPTAKLPALPAWAKSIHFVATAFQTGLVRGMDIVAARTLSTMLRIVGADVDEYAFDTIARELIDEAGNATEASESVGRWRAVLGWLFEASRGGASSLQLLRINIITKRGAVARAGQCYFGPDYSLGSLVGHLYDAAEVVADAASNGLPTGEEHATAVESFLKQLGIASRPREATLQGNELEAFSEAVVRGLQYPAVIRGRRFSTAESFIAEARLFRIEHARIPDRLPMLLASADPALVCAYLLSSGATMIAEPRDRTARFAAKLPREQFAHEDEAIVVPNATLHLLRETAWVPVEGGGKRRPREVVIGRHAAAMLHGLYARHSISTNHPQVLGYGGAHAVDLLLVRLGALSSLEELSAASVYDLLLTMSERDPRGENAPRLYRALLDAEIEPDDDLPAKKRFHQEGLMWARHQGSVGYQPVKELRYNANVTLPRLIEPLLKLVALPDRRDRTRVKQLFGVQTLGSADVKLSIDVAQTCYRDESEHANAHLHAAKPFLYALRMASTSEHERDAKLLDKARLHVCEKASVDAVLPGGKTQKVVLREGEPVVVESDLLIVSEYPSDSDGPRWIQFWQSVAGLVGDLMGPGYPAGVVGNLIRCRGTAEMEAIVLGLLGPDAEANLRIARTRFGDPEAPPVDEHVFPLVPEREPAATETDGAVATAGEAEKTPTSTPHQPPTPPAGPFAKVDGPAQQPTRKRKLVVTGKVSPAGRGKGPVATEDVTFAVVEAFERQEGRFAISVKHLRGSDAFGCDIVSVASDEIRIRALENRALADSDVTRYIEVKGSSARRGLLELTENEEKAARRATKRYFIYRVYVQVAVPGSYEIAILSDPFHTKAVRTVTKFDLAEGSGADWYGCETKTSEEQAEASSTTRD